MTNNGVRKQKELIIRRRHKITTEKNDKVSHLFLERKNNRKRKFNCFYIYLWYKSTHGKWGEPMSYLLLHWKVIWGLYLIVFQLSYLFKCANTVILVLSDASLRIQRCLRNFSYVLEIFFQLYFCGTIIWGRGIIPLCVVLAEGWGKAVCNTIISLSLPW